MSVWTLNGGTCQPQGVNLMVAGTDNAVVEIRPAHTAAVPSAGDWVTLACDGQPVLYGQASGGKYVNGQRDAWRVELKGPWQMLERVIYQQGAKVAVADSGAPSGYSLVSVLLPDVQLGMDDDGETRTTAQEITAILNYAIASGVPITFDIGITGRDIPLVSMSGQSCAAALLALLDWHPEAVAFFSYGSGSAVLHIQPLSALDTVNVSGGDGGADRVTGAEFRPCLDFKPAGVRIVYLRTGLFGRVELGPVDQAGEVGVQGKAPDVINWVVRLEGKSPGPVQEQEVRTKSLPAADEPSGVKNFWRRHLPWLDSPAAASGTTIMAHQMLVDSPDADADPSGELEDEVWPTDPGDLPRELIRGSIQPWMQVEAAGMTVRAKITWTGGTVPEDLRGVFGAGGTRVVPVSVKVTATDATTRNYRGLQEALTLPDWPSAGLATAFMASLPSMVWQGSLTVTGEAQPLNLRPGEKLNVSGYESGWGSMNAVIQSVTLDAAGHTATATCGPPETMDFGDFYALQRLLNRREYVSIKAAYARRTQGLPGSGGKVSGGKMTPKASTLTLGGTGGDDLRGLQVVVRKNEDDTWNIGITPGTVDDVVPTREPDGAEIVGAPVFWFPDYDETAEEESHSRQVWLKILIDDSDPYQGIVSAAEIHLREDEPSPKFSQGNFQWHRLGDAAGPGDGTLTASRSVSGSVKVVRAGPGAGYRIYAV